MGRRRPGGTHSRPAGRYGARGEGGHTYDNHTNEPWPNGVCGHCGARQQSAGIGLEPTLEEWLANIVAVLRDVRRVLRDDGSVWLNLGDAYVGSGSWGNFGQLV